MVTNYYTKNPKDYRIERRGGTIDDETFILSENIPLGQGRGHIQAALRFVKEVVVSIGGKFLYINTNVIMCLYIRINDIQYPSN